MIVGLYSNVPQSGKSTVARVFQNAGYKKLSFATPVKQSLKVVLEALGVVDPDAYLCGKKKDIVIPELGVTNGYFMSSYATTYMRDMIDEDIWLDALKRYVVPGLNYVIDDLRFYNEYQWLVGTGGVTIKINRTGAIKQGRVASSEGQLSRVDFDYVLDNNGSMADLVKKVNFVLTQL